MANTVEIQIIGGVEGECLAINDTRVAGPKPWGGGSILKTWNVPVEKLKAIIKEAERKAA